MTRYYSEDEISEIYISGKELFAEGHRNAILQILNEQPEIKGIVTRCCLPSVTLNPAIMKRPPSCDIEPFEMVLVVDLHVIREGEDKVCTEEELTDLVIEKSVEFYKTVLRYH